MTMTSAPKNSRAPDPNRQFLYVANRWRHSVLKYDTTVVLDSQNRPVSITSTFVSEILGVGNNPWRLALSDHRLPCRLSRGGSLRHRRHPQGGRP